MDPPSESMSSEIGTNPLHAGPEKDDRAVVWFDIDNTLYSASSRIADAMGERIHAYFTALGLSDDEASKLHLKYFRQYGLALRGLLIHHDVDTLDFNQRCDGSLPLEEMLKPDPSVRQLLKDIDRSKARVWALTNAYVSHARRVLKILELEDQFEGVVFCDYTEKGFYCKPEPEFFNTALKKAGVTDPSLCYFIDDSKRNIDAANGLGWGHCVYFCEAGLETTEGGVRKQILAGESTGDLAERVQVETLEELRGLWPELFRTCTSAGTT